MLQVEIYDSKTLKLLTTLEDVSGDELIVEVKERVRENIPHLNTARQSLRLQPRGKSLDDHEKLYLIKGVNAGDRLQLYLKDLGPQIGWKTVFILEYLGPLVIYPLFFVRFPWLYGSQYAYQYPKHVVVRLALACWTFHYAKRLYETMWVHRFSHATMPFTNLFKNCTYYWLFAAFVSFHINHPFYTPPHFGSLRMILGLSGFVIGEIGNYSIHVAMSNLRPPGSKVRRIPLPTSNPFTILFDFVSVPNYTYEILAWFSFSIMTQCLPALMFAMCGAYQMTIWALAKHKAYKKEFASYPQHRRAIFPFIL
ncbi:Synaptic glycoprotein SC2 [Trichuris trichiura]|uniref:Synaptic glycoprotein SC2 n=1 Tax=Trichuris trichiura TaxID=36087 RepID=A0A077ZGM2_TRITR|nr:Synaptic glycoprotein SC2 [Trichuris trichiura]